ncbi:PREDICTED: uncharacterized protein LOC105313115 [Amphimedon queenslandica]|uniref:Uncharacterized protein n=2 Tax=Amphimedon queenslandica TaxID=400682 RepID=A0AAN0J9C3_AMPQE|nr:PREDICTED: uncharacterized protein LOC105313115 [Amphimedon queenslandica]|eukprot:XP_019853347.1 PREDICTED: uncharacterized protein LOC105313115 [Amphimedon queenslandica]
MISDKIIIVLFLGGLANGMTSEEGSKISLIGAAAIIALAVIIIFGLMALFFILRSNDLIPDCFWSLIRQKKHFKFNTREKNDTHITSGEHNDARNSAELYLELCSLAQSTQNVSVVENEVYQSRESCEIEETVDSDSDYI